MQNNITASMLKPLPGKILVKQLPDETVTKSGIILPKDKPVNKQTVYVEVVAVGKNISDDMRLKIQVEPGQKCILGRVPYDVVLKNNEAIYWVINPIDVMAIVE